MTGDDVVQFLIEEAVFERLAFMETRDRADSLPGPLEPDPMQRARDFAEGRI